MKPMDLTGLRFGRLEVISRAGNTPSGKTRWNCLCDCGEEVIVRGEDIRSGRTKSCGCLKIEIAREALKKQQTTHGETETRLHRIWASMKQRCNNPNSKAYASYGGRGITVCDEWRDSFEAFRDWALANGYREDLTIDRKDNDKGYCPDNCRWATMKAQQNNRRNNRWITHNGKTQRLSQWAEQTGISVETIMWRLKAGWPDSDLFMPTNLNNARIRKGENKDA